jgi:hypothetical protein
MEKLIRVNRQASNDLLQLEELSKAELVAVRSTFKKVIAARDQAKAEDFEHSPDPVPAVASHGRPAVFVKRR